MKKLLLIALVAGGLTFAAAPRSDAQVYFSVGVGPGYYGGYYPTATIIRIGLTTGRIGVTPITGRTTGTADTDITTATIVTTTITDTKVT